MDNEQRARRPNEAPSALGGTVALGLIAAPDIPEKIANGLAAKLPNLLGKRIDDRFSWDVSVVIDPSRVPTGQPPRSSTSAGIGGSGKAGTWRSASPTCRSTGAATSSWPTIPSITADHNSSVYCYYSHGQLTC
jgi:hypothetical protein